MSDQKPSVGRTVHFTPSQKFTGPSSVTLYAALITRVNLVPEGAESQLGDTVDLATFGPSSLYFQHNVPFSPEPKAGCWSWPARV